MAQAWLTSPAPLWPARNPASLPWFPQGKSLWEFLVFCPLRLEWKKSLKTIERSRSCHGQEPDHPIEKPISALGQNDFPCWLLGDFICTTTGFYKVTTVVERVNGFMEFKAGPGTSVICSDYFCHMLVRSWEISLAILSILFRLWEFLAPVIFSFEAIAAIWGWKQKSIYRPATHIIQK